MSGRKLEEIILPESITHIRFWVFRLCSSLKEITLPKGVTVIEPGAFDGCTSLTSITFMGMISSDDFYNDKYYPCFPGDLRDKYLAGGRGTYTREAGSNTWTKQ